MKNLIPFIFFLLIIFIGCKKDEVETKVSLTSKTWKPSLIDKNASSNPSGQVSYNAIQDCDKDDTYSFGIDGKLTISRGAIKCNNNELSTEIINYSFNVSSKELIIKGVKYIVTDESAQLKYYTAIPSNTGTAYIIFLFE